MSVGIYIYISQSPVMNVCSILVCVCSILVCVCSILVCNRQCTGM